MKANNAYTSIKIHKSKISFNNHFKAVAFVNEYISSDSQERNLIGRKITDIYLILYSHTVVKQEVTTFMVELVTIVSYECIISAYCQWLFKTSFIDDNYLCTNNSILQ